MLDELKKNLLNQASPETLLSQLGRPAFVHNLSMAHLEELAKIVEGKTGNFKIQPKVATAIYSIIVMKGCENYNTKAAIETLTKYYRQLAQPEKQEPVQSSTIGQTKTRQVLANLLIRIPTFSNYKLIIKDLNPDLLPLSLILQHRSQMCKQCPNLYKDYLVKEHRYVWYRLMEGEEEGYQISQDLGTIRVALQKLGEGQDVTLIYERHQEIEKLVEFIRNRVQSVQKEELNIEDACQQFQRILTFSIAPSTDRKVLPLQLISTQSKFIRSTKSSVTQLLRCFVIKYGYFLIRKFSWLVSILKELLMRPYDQFSIEPHYLIDLLKTLLEQFGLGFFDFDKLVKNQDGYCLSVLVSALCYNDYSHNNKRESSLVNYQAPKSQGKKKNDIQINLHNTTEVDSAYEPYLKTTTPYLREVLLNKILGFLMKYYERKSQVTMPFYQSTQILEALACSKNSISQRNKKIISDIKHKVLFKDFKQIGDHFESFCEDTFNSYIKKKKERKFEIQRSLQLIVEPTQSKSVDRIAKSMINSRQEQASNDGQLRRTNSFDVEFEGWSNQKNSKRSEERGEKSQMFYSIKECSAIDQSQIGKKKEIEQEEHEFLLTPEF